MTSESMTHFRLKSKKNRLLEANPQLSLNIFETSRECLTFPERCANVGSVYIQDNFLVETRCKIKSKIVAGELGIILYGVPIDLSVLMAYRRQQLHRGCPCHIYIYVQWYSND